MYKRTSRRDPLNLSEAEAREVAFLDRIMAAMSDSRRRSAERRDAILKRAYQRSRDATGQIQVRQGPADDRVEE